MIMKKFRKKQLIEVVKDTQTGKLVQNVDNPHDQWEIDHQTFDKTYEPAEHHENMIFGQAIESLKEGKKVSRKGWNGKGMFLYYVPPGRYPARTEVAKSIGEFVDYGAYIAMKTAQGNVVPWLASQTDVLSEDWEVVE